MSVLTTLCATLCFWSASSDPQATFQSQAVTGQPSGPYAFNAQAVNPILTHHGDVLIAPVERYVQGARPNEQWWNPAFFGTTAAELERQEQEWESPFLSAYYQFVNGGGHEGIAITFTINEAPACLLETEVIVLLGSLLATPGLAQKNLPDALKAWHEYGHCLFHARAPSWGVERDIRADTRYPIELFADAYAIAKLWQLSGIDATPTLIAQRERGYAYTGDATHWTAPALPTWQAYLVGNVNPQTAPSELEDTLMRWVTGHDWVAIRNAQTTDVQQ